MGRPHWEVTFEQELEAGKRRSHGDVRGRSLPGEATASAKALRSAHGRHVGGQQGDQCVCDQEKGGGQEVGTERSRPDEVQAR